MLLLSRAEESGSSRVPFDKLRAGCSEPGVVGMFLPLTTLLCATLCNCEAGDWASGILVQTPPGEGAVDLP